MLDAQEASSLTQKDRTSSTSDEQNARAVLAEQKYSHTETVHHGRSETQAAED